MNHFFFDEVQENAKKRAEEKSAWARYMEEYGSAEYDEDDLEYEKAEIPWFKKVKDFHPVNKPLHYNMGKVETIEYIESALGQQGAIDYCIGNVIKYVSRWRNKGGREDLEKAAWYLSRALKNVDA